MSKNILALFNVLSTHISPLGWAHILLTGEYRWRRKAGAKL